MNKFYKIYNENYISKASAHARVNLIGEHTDYTGGYVLPKLLNNKTEIFISINNINHRVYSNLFKETVSFNTLKKSKNNHWIDYVKGCLYILKKNFNLPNNFFNILIKSNIPMNKGISSSAALSVALLKAINNYYKLNIKNDEIAILAQKVEREFIGVTCGIMDQMVTSIGIQNKAFFLECSNLKYELINIPNNYLFYLIDSKIQRKIRESLYNKRYKEIKQAEKFLKPKTLFDASVLDINNLEFTDNIIKKRAIHVVTENQRVLEAKNALTNSDINYFGKLMNESHRSYSEYFEASNKEIDDIVKKSIECGAKGSRLTGGGFGGFIVSLVNKKNHEEWKSNMLKFYQKERFLI